MAGAGRRQRAVMATDSEWEVLRERAAAAGMDISRFILERLAAPATPEAAPDDGALARIERTVLMLEEVERERMVRNGAAATWAELGRRVDGRLAAELRR